MDKKLKPNCPKCYQNANVVEFLYFFRCAFCGTKFFKNEEKGQTKLNI